jgi:curved DNA-binding protein CbpA
VAPRASQDEIAKAYHTLAARYHPDKHQGNVLEDLARDKLIALNEAFAVLRTPAVRARYDAARRGMSPSQRYAGTPPGPAPKSALVTLRGLLLILLLLAAIPLLLRFIRSPKVLAVIAVAVVLAWFGPRFIRWLKK